MAKFSAVRFAKQAYSCLWLIYDGNTLTGELADSGSYSSASGFKVNNFPASVEKADTIKATQQRTCIA